MSDTMPETRYRDLLDEALFDIDVHLIPERKGTPAHYHYDFRFLIQAGDRDFIVGTESNDLAWLDVTKPLESLADDSIIRMQLKTRAALKRAGKPRERFDHGNSQLSKKELR